jgi:hypothetical protein
MADPPPPGRECGRILRAARKPHAAGYVLDAQNIRDEQTGIVQHQLIIAEPNAVVHAAFIHPPQTASGKLPCSPKTLPRAPHPDQRQPEHPGREHRAQPPGCLDRPRRHLATAALINTEAHSTRSDINGQPMVQ